MHRRTLVQHTHTHKWEEREREVLSKRTTHKLDTNPIDIQSHHSSELVSDIPALQSGAAKQTPEQLQNISS